MSMLDALKDRLTFKQQSWVLVIGLLVGMLTLVGGLMISAATLGAGYGRRHP